MPVDGGVEEWLSALLREIKSSVSENMYLCFNNINDGSGLDDWTSKYCEQVCVMSLMYIWTKESESGINEIRLDRKALANAAKKYSTYISRLSSILSKCSIKTAKNNVLQRLRIESMLGVCIIKIFSLIKNPLIYDMGNSV